MKDVPERRIAIDAARTRWIQELTDLGRRNNLLYFRDLKAGTLSLSVNDRDPGAWESLLAGASVNLSSLLLRADAKAVSAKALEIGRRALSNLEERGLDTLFLAIGFSSWPASDGGSAPHAPVLLVPAAIKRQGRQGNQGGLVLTGELRINPVLLQKLEADLGIALSAEQLLPHESEVEIPPGSLHRLIFENLRRALQRVSGFRVNYDAALGNFAFYKMAMVEDLSADPEWLCQSDLVAALAGDQNAKQAVTSTRVEVDPRQIDIVPPANEFLVLDADSSQQATIAGALSLQSGVIVGPPGTGKSQTIANLIAEFAARGKRILFVAEKRAALDVVQSRLAAVGLGHLTLDLHGVGLRRAQILKQFAETLDAIRAIPPVDAEELHRRFEERRKQLREHVRLLHDPQPPSGLSAYRLQGLVLSTNEGDASETRWRGAELDRLTPDIIAEASDLIREAGGFVGLIEESDPSPWRNANLLDGKAVASAVDAVHRLAIGDWPELNTTLSEFLKEVGVLPPPDLAGIQNLLDLQARINVTLEQLAPEIFAADLNDLQRKLLAIATNPVALAFKWCLSSGFRNFRRQMRALDLRSKSSFKALRIDLLAAAAERIEWRKLAGPDTRPFSSRSLTRCRKAFDKVTESLKSLEPILRQSGLTDLPVAKLDTFIRNLADDNVTPYRLPRYHEIGRKLPDLGVASLFRELRAASRSPDKWPALLLSAWYSSSLDAIRAKFPQFGGFNGRVHDDVVEEFKRLDEERLKYSVDRVLRAHAEHAVAVMNQYPDQESLVRQEAHRQRGGLSFRNLASRTSDVLLALRPCWLASPLSVSELLPRVSGMFDVVLFDEASQILPADAQPALARANNAIVAGDPNQLPPSTFFATGADAENVDDEDATFAGFQSLLTQMLGLLSPWSLNWHYRSRDESLIAFSNHYIYGDRLTTFPGTGIDGSAITHVLVPSAAGRDGQEESSTAEVRKVVELILDHASKRPNESLGVIALGLTHANKVQAALDQALRDHPELDDFFDERKSDRFFVKNLERVQGDERDAIILTVGYGGDRTGRLLYQFGPLVQEGGERRLNVAITRAKSRITVVSSFDHRDMDPARSTKRGVELLRLYLEYAASGGKTLGDRGTTNVPLDPFEADVSDALAARGAHLLAQYGVSGYRIDLVAEHPQHPGRLVLAIECDGASYHSAPTTRDRDRLRQQHLEALGWRFHRIWSTDWFLRREEEIQRALDAIKAATTYADLVDDGERLLTSPPDQEEKDLATRNDFPLRGARPRIVSGKNVASYTTRELAKLVQWIWSDGRLKTDDETLDEMVKVLGFQRRGPKMVAIIRNAIAQARVPEASVQAGPSPSRSSSTQA